MNNYIDYWSAEKNPETGAKFEHFRRYMDCTHNGKADIPALLASEYGEKLTNFLELRFQFEDLEPMSPRILEYYRGLKIVKQMFDTKDYFTRWAMFTPAELEERKYPLIIWNHGGKESIEDEEFVTDLIPNLVREKYIVIMPQNTCWDSVKRIIEQASDIAPIDRERVYVGGFSQGGRLAFAAALRMPEMLAGIVLNGGPVFDSTDSHSVPFTVTEVENMTAKLVPFMQIQNQCDVSNVVPLNDYHKRRKTPKIDNHYRSNPAYDMLKDPTYQYEGATRERINPPEGYDVHEWLMDILNTRMMTQWCEPRDRARCLSYINMPEDEFHHAVGFYGDRETIEEIYGVKHYTVDIFNRNGLNSFRYVVVANTSHWPPVTLAEQIWNYFKQFRRDSATGQIVYDPYIS